MLKSLLKDIVTRPRVAREEDSNREVERSEDSERWLQDLVVRMFALMHRSERDNFDSDRFRNQSPDAFFYDRHAAYFLFLLKHLGKFFHARQLLEDEASRALYDQLILYRMLGHLHVRLPFNTPANRAHVATAQSWRVSDTGDVGAFGPLSIYNVPAGDHEIRVKGWKENVTCTFLYRQYYFDRGGVKIEPVAGDHVVDAGGCFGDTALGFADVVGERGHVYVFDPLPKHCAIMREQLDMNPLLAPRISIFAAGLSDRVNDLPALASDDVINPGARVMADAMPMSTIDAAVGSNAPRLDFIKMDIEGSELDALRGAESSIRRWQPKLAISLYHRPEDFFLIPSWIDSLGVGYRLYLDHYSIHQEETVLYAMA